MRRLSCRWASLPLGVIGNTPDSGSGESWFDPRRGNSRRDAEFIRVALLVFLGPASVLQAFTPLPLLGLSSADANVALAFLTSVRGHRTRSRTRRMRGPASQWRRRIGQ